MPSFQSIEISFFNMAQLSAIVLVQFSSILVQNGFLITMANSKTIVFSEVYRGWHYLTDFKLSGTLENPFFRKWFSRNNRFQTNFGYPLSLWCHANHILVLLMYLCWFHLISRKQVLSWVSFLVSLGFQGNLKFYFTLTLLWRTIWGGSACRNLYTQALLST